MFIPHTNMISNFSRTNKLYSIQQATINHKQEKMHSPDYFSALSSSLLDTVIGGEYEILEDLGHGSYGALYLGQSLKTHDYYAIKVLSKALDPSQLQLQQMEIDIQSSLKHTNLLELINVFENNGLIFMVMELCDQGDLFEHVIEDQKHNDVRETGFVKTVFLQILEAIEHMHAQGYYHRDLKLENILLKYNDNDVLECKVADFGLATDECYSAEFGCGSTSYLAPEHFDDDNCKTSKEPMYSSAASDVWSLGVLLLAMMFGRNPWREATSHDDAFAEYMRNPSMLKEELFPLLSPGALRFVTLALSVDAADRPSISELKKQFMTLNNLYGDEEIAEEPIDIPSVSLTKITMKDEDDELCGSCDSAFFSLGKSIPAWPITPKDKDIAAAVCGHSCHNPFSAYHGAFDPGGMALMPTLSSQDAKTFHTNTTPVNDMYSNREEPDIFLFEDEDDNWFR